MEHLKGYITYSFINCIDSTDIQYVHFLEKCTASKYSDVMWWRIEGYVKLMNEKACEKLLSLVFKSDYPIENKAQIIKLLSQITNNNFEQGKPLECRSWKESDIDYERLKEWADNGYIKGNGYILPKRHICLDNPNTKEEKLFARLDKKLLKKREKRQSLAYPTNWLIEAEKSDLEKILKKYNLPPYYIEFLEKASPLNTNFKIKGYGLVEGYSANNLIQRQEGYSYNPVKNTIIKDWNKDLLVIANAFGDPFCIDLSKENSLIYFAIHGQEKWEFTEKFEDFYNFLKVLTV